MRAEATSNKSRLANFGNKVSAGFRSLAQKLPSLPRAARIHPAPAASAVVPSTIVVASSRPSRSSRSSTSSDGDANRLYDQALALRDRVRDMQFATADVAEELIGEMRRVEKIPEHVTDKIAVGVFVRNRLLYNTNDDDAAGLAAQAKPFVEDSSPAVSMIATALVYAGEVSELTSALPRFVRENSPASITVSQVVETVFKLEQYTTACNAVRMDPCTSVTAAAGEYVGQVEAAIAQGHIDRDQFSITDQILFDSAMAALRTLAPPRAAATVEHGMVPAADHEEAAATRGAWNSRA